MDKVYSTPEVMGDVRSSFENVMFCRDSLKKKETGLDTPIPCWPCNTAKPSPYGNDISDVNQHLSFYLLLGQKIRREFEKCCVDKPGMLYICIR